MPSENLQEREILLLTRIAKGDRESFSELYDRFADILFATAMTVTHQREIAEEVVQDVFVQIWQKASLYNPGRGKPLTWAITLTRNRAIDRLRGQHRQARLLEDAQREGPPNDPASQPDSSHLAAIAESADLARQALVKLPPDQRKAIEMVFLQGLTMAQVADQTGELLPTIKGRVRRGLLRLRELLRSKLQRPSSG